MTQNNPEQGRRYTRFIAILRGIQYFGYFIVVAFSLIALWGAGIFVGTPQVIFPVIFALLQAVIGCLIVYVFTQGLIAIVDLLSRIELNTRK